MEEYFQRGIEGLIAYKEEKGHLRVPKRYKMNEGTPDEFALGKWVSSRRGEYNSKTRPLSEERINRLNEIGFIWDLKKE